jgi:hypothetical protein
MDATITYDEVAALVGVNIPTTFRRWSHARISREFARYVDTSKDAYNASHALKASNTDGREW